MSKTRGKQNLLFGKHGKKNWGGDFFFPQFAFNFTHARKWNIKYFLEPASYHHRDKTATYLDSQEMRSNFWNSKNCFSVKVVYPRKKITVIIKLYNPCRRFCSEVRTFLELPLFSHFSPAEERNSRFLLVDLRFNQYWPLLDVILFHLTSSSEFWASWTNLNASSYILILFPSGLAMCFYLCLCSSFELFQHAKSLRNHLRRSAELPASFVLQTGSV